LDAAREAGLSGLDEHVDVVPDLGRAEELPPVPGSRPGQTAVVRSAVVVVEEQRQAVDAPGVHVVDPGRELGAERPRHFD
jgi:hypothetical protein